MRVVVTGAKGQLGMELMTVLGHAHEVVGLDLPEWDMTTPEAEQQLQDIGPSWVVHTAAATDVDRCERNPEWAFALNAVGPHRVAESCRRMGAGMLYLSTDYVFDGRKNAPYREHDLPAPLSVYGQSKLQGELATQSLAPRWTIVRTAWLYGAHGKNFVKAIKSKAMAGGPLRVVDDQVGSPTYAADLAHAIARLLEKEVTGTFHLTNSGACSWCEFAKRILELAGYPNVPLSAITSSELARPAPRPMYSVLDNAAWRAAGFSPLRTWPDALTKMLKVLSQHEGLIAQVPNATPS